MAGLEDLTGETIGPVVVEATGDRVADFVSVVGDDPVRWSETVHPLFANAALFAVAAPFLEDPRVAPLTTSLLHSEQRYIWERPASVGERFSVTGEVAVVRRRGALNLVGFDLGVDGESGPWLTGTSQFMMSDEPAAATPEEREPSPTERPAVDAAFGRLPLPEVGEALESVAVGASRFDLVRYAAATRDWNPIHWDHASAVAAGLPGVIVHGLLLAAWVGRAALRYAAEEPPLQAMAIRFRRPLRPAMAAMVEGTVAGHDPSGSDLDLRVTAEGEALVTARVRVTP